MQLTRAPIVGGEHILTSQALAFLAHLQLRFGGRRDELVAARHQRREDISRSGRLDFLPETAEVHDGDWMVAAAPYAVPSRSRRPRAGGTSSTTPTGCP
ncbi:MAG: hypothetical protein ABI873_15535 [Marmoricola sp.]